MRPSTQAKKDAMLILLLIAAAFTAVVVASLSLFVGTFRKNHVPEKEDTEKENWDSATKDLGARTRARESAMKRLAASTRKQREREMAIKQQRRNEFNAMNRMPTKRSEPPAEFSSSTISSVPMRELSYQRTNDVWRAGPDQEQQQQLETFNAYQPTTHRMSSYV